MKKTLIHMAYPLSPMIYYEFDLIQKKIDEGCKIYLLYCNASAKYCAANRPSFNKYNKMQSICTLCVSKVKNNLNWFSNLDNIEILDFDNLNIAEERYLISIEKRINAKNLYKTLRHLNKKYKLIDLENTIYTTMSSDLKTLDFKFENYFNLFLKTLLETLRSYYSIINHINHINPDEFYLFNGRNYKYQPSLKIGQNILGKRNVKIYEKPKWDKLNYLIIKNNYPHDLYNLSKQISKEKINYKNDKIFLQKGKLWFENRIKRKKTNFYQQYKNLQVKGNLPPIPSKKKIISIFLTTEYENMSLVENLKRFKFKKQSEAVQNLLKSFSKNKDVFFFIRDNPNERKKNRIETLRNISSKYNFISFYILPNSKVDSYKLAKISDLIITFGSTVGLESFYLGKNVINMGSSWFCKTNNFQHFYSKKKFLKFISKSIDLKKSKKLQKNNAIKFLAKFYKFTNNNTYVRNNRIFGNYLFKNKIYFIKGNFILEIFYLFIRIIRRILKYFKIKFEINQY